MTSTSTDRRNGVNSSAAIKVPVRVATTANLSALSGLLTVDGITLAVDDRVLVKNQTTGADNGIYVVSSSTWSRALDFDGRYDVLQGTMVFVKAGTTYANTMWRISTADPITVGTTSLSFSQISFAGSADSSSPEDFGAAGDGTTNDAVAVQAWLTDLQSGGYGIARNTYNLGTTTCTLTLALSPDRENTYLDMGGAKFLYSGTTYPFDFTDDGNNDAANKLIVVGPKVVLTGTSATAGFRVSDMGGVTWLYPEVIDETNSGAGFTATAILARNYDGYSERGMYIGVRGTDCKKTLHFQGAAASGGGGTESFARTVVRDCIGSGNEYFIHVEQAGLYDSIIDGVRGNSNVQKAAVFWRGTAGGTVVRNIGTETGRSVTFTGSITASDQTLTATGAPFASTDVGWYVLLPGAGPNGTDLLTVITSFTNTGSVEVQDAASTTISGVATCTMGTVGFAMHPSGTSMPVLGNIDARSGIADAYLGGIAVAGYVTESGDVLYKSIRSVSSLSDADRELVGFGGTSGAYYGYYGYGASGSANGRIATFGGIAHNGAVPTVVAEYAAARGSATDEGRAIIRIKATGQSLADALRIRRDGTSPASQVTELIIGDGSPEGVVSAVVGSKYVRADGTYGTLAYMKQAGSGNTGWIPYNGGQSITNVSTSSTAAPRTVTAAEAGAVFTNQGGSTINAFTLPTAEIGLGPYTFTCRSTAGLRVNAGSSGTIRIAGSVSASTGRIDTVTVGDSVTLSAYSGTVWIAQSVVNSAGWTVT